MSKENTRWVQLYQDSDIVPIKKSTAKRRTKHRLNARHKSHSVKVIVQDVTSVEEAAELVQSQLTSGTMTVVPMRIKR